MYTHYYNIIASIINVYACTTCHMCMWKPATAAHYHDKAIQVPLVCKISGVLDKFLCYLILLQNFKSISITNLATYTYT